MNLQKRQLGAGNGVGGRINPHGNGALLWLSLQSPLSDAVPYSGLPTGSPGTGTEEHRVSTESIENTIASNTDEPFL